MEVGSGEGRQAANEWRRTRSGRREGTSEWEEVGDLKLKEKKRFGEGKGLKIEEEEKSGPTVESFKSAIEPYELGTDTFTGLILITMWETLRTVKNSFLLFKFGLRL